MLLPLAATAGTAPWLSTGDRGLRSDVELLAAYGLAGGPITTWPIPTRQLLHGLSDQARLDQAPLDVQLAAQRVLTALTGPDPDSSVHLLARLMTTNQPTLVRDFASQARDEADVAACADVFDYIEVFYNRTRRHSHLGGVSPEAFERASL